MNVIKIIEEGRTGGPQMDMLRVTPFVQKMGVTINVILPRYDSDKFQQHLTEANIPFFTIPMTTLRKHPKQLILYTFKFIPEILLLTRLIWKMKPDIVHVSGGAWQIKGVLAGRLAGRKVIWHLNDTQTPKVLKLLFRAVQPFAHAFITAGYRVQEYYLKNEVKRQIFNISAPVDCSVFDPALIKKTHSENVSRIITVANINPIKGLEQFLEIAAKLNHKVFKPLEFRIIGPVFDSQILYFKKLKELTKKLKLNNLVFVGGIEDVREELANADIFVCTSVSEASPTSVWEAMALGKPIVSTSVGEVDFIIKNGVSGLVCENHDTLELSEKIKYLLFHDKIKEKIGKSARKRAIEVLNVDSIANQHYRAYQSVISPNKDINYNLIGPNT